MRYHVTLRGRNFEVDLGGEVPRIDGQAVDAALATVPGTPLRHLLLGTESHSVLAARASEGRWNIAHRGERFDVEVLDERAQAIRRMGGAAVVEGPKTILAPMPGLVVRIEIAVGDAVVAGQPVLVVEAMKMENALKAPSDGVVVRIEAIAGQAVEKGAVLVVLE
jgi:biotin carboxyl carrier protein